MHYFRKIITITAEDSPNVRRARLQLARGMEPDNTEVVPGVLTWQEYQFRRKTWDPIRQSIGLDAKFYEGAEILLFPSLWLDSSALAARALVGRARKALGIGIDPAEGGDKTAMAAVDQYGLIELRSRRTPDTSVVCDEALAFMAQHGVPADRVIFDRGGGGKEHADLLRRRGYKVRTVAFGEAITLDPVRRLRMLEERLDQREEHHAYVNRRAQMYGELSLLIDPNWPSVVADVVVEGCWAIPEGITGDPSDERSELRHQLAPIPREYDEGRLRLRSKSRKPGQDENDHKTLTELIGHSPDEADAVVLAVHAMLHRESRPKVRIA